VWCDDLSGCCSQGPTRREALANIREAIREWLDAQPEVKRRLKVKVERQVITV
jgi:predicted RNase H-like HicB family nuclease